jgi:hypothetical protein
MRWTLSAAHAAVLASAAPADKTHIDQLFPTRSSATRLIAILRMSEQPGCRFISANARACNSRIESRVFAIQFVAWTSKALLSRAPMASSLVIVASASPMQHARIVAVVIANSKRPGMSCTNRVAVPVGRGDAGAAINRDVTDG